MGFHNPYYGTRTGEGQTAGRWLVGNEGVYILSNRKLCKGQKTLVINAEQCRPKGDRQVGLQALPFLG